MPTNPHSGEGAPSAGRGREEETGGGERGRRVPAPGGVLRAPPRAIGNPSARIGWVAWARRRRAARRSRVVTRPALEAAASGLRLRRTLPGCGLGFR